MSVLGTVVTFVVALLIGGLAIHIGARTLTGKDDYKHAVVTALFGAIAWAALSWIPLIGFLLALVAWVWVINWRYPGGWVRAVLIGVVAWVAAVVILYVLNDLLDLGIEALGVP